jgi:hypothetical protein
MTHAQRLREGADSISRISMLLVTAPARLISLFLILM